jgi:hypothetical protein
MVHDVDEPAQEAQDEFVMDDHAEEEDHEADKEQNGEALKDNEEIPKEPQKGLDNEDNDEPALSEESGDNGSGTTDDKDDSNPLNLEPAPRCNLRANWERQQTRTQHDTPRTQKAMTCSSYSMAPPGTKEEETGSQTHWEVMTPNSYSKERLQCPLYKRQSRVSGPAVLRQRSMITLSTS